MKFEKNGNIVEVNDPNTFNVFIREGFVMVEEKEKPKREKVNKDE